MPSFFNVMPVDKTTIKTALRIHPALFDNADAFLRKRDLEIRSVKPGGGNPGNRSTRRLTIDFLRYKGIKVELTKTTGVLLTDAKIHFNPGVCLYNHNGRTLSLREFLHALALLVKHLQPLLSDADDWVDLVPGLRDNGRAYWAYLEVPSQCLDPTGAILATFRNLRHPSITTPTRHWPDSILVGGARSKLVLSIYRKAVEMIGHDKLSEQRLPVYEDVLRIEARTKDEKLVHYFGDGRNVEIIDGTGRLVSFYPRDLVRGHRECFSELEGVYSSTEASAVTSKPLVALGRTLALATLDTGTTVTFPELLAHIRFYTGASSDTICEIRKAGLEELSRRSSISCDDLFSDAAYRRQIGIASDEPEEKVCHEFEDTFVHPLISAAYQPSDQPFTPITQWPSYLRI